MNRIEGVDFAEYLELCGRQESQSIRSLAEAAESIWERMAKGPDINGDPLPWSKTHQEIRLRRGEVSIWAGVNGHGKSQILSHISTSLMMVDPICVASLEMPMSAIGERLVQQMSGQRQVVREMFDQLIAETDQRYWVYDETDTVEPERILGMTIYAAKELGCGHVIIDSLVKCGLAMSKDRGAEQQKDFVDRLCWAAKTYNVHIHLVHHMRKGESEDKPGNKMDVKGAGEITDLVDNVFIVWRNKPKERAIANGDAYPGQESEPDTLLSVDKQRHGEWEGRIGLWFDVESKRYLQHKDERVFTV